MECAACFVDTSADGAAKDPVANAARFLQNSGTPHPHSGRSSPLVRIRNREVGTRTRNRKLYFLLKWIGVGGSILIHGSNLGAALLVDLLLFSAYLNALGARI
jgi:hypothetical protein